MSLLQASQGKFISECALYGKSDVLAGAPQRRPLMRLLILVTHWEKFSDNCGGTGYVRYKGKKGAKLCHQVKTHKVNCTEADV